MKFIKFAPIILLASCITKTPEPAINSDSLSSKQARVTVVKPKPKSEQKTIKIQVNNNVEFTEEIYISEKAAPFIKVEPKPTPAKPQKITAEPTLPKAQKGSINFLASVIYHKSGESNIDMESKAALAEVARFVENKDGSVKVYGHASAKTKGLKPAQAKKINFEVSKKRALAVKTELIKDKVPAKKIRAFAAGDKHPAVPETDATAEAINRRTEIFIRY